jgi:hypothetical protein
MGKVMISKKFKFIVAFIMIQLVNGLTVSELRGQGVSSSSSALPVLRYAGVIPVQWDKSEDWHDVNHLKSTMDAEFSKAVRGSKRFMVLNDDLVSNLWNSPGGRKELEQDYELSAYASLNILTRGDVIVLTARLLSPGLDTRLQENEVITRKDFALLSGEQASSKLVDLVMRMINRLPVDAHVSSINGGYVTLSAGTEQGLKVGNSFDVYSALVSNLHPANGGWLSFATTKTGTVEVIEVKTQSSIAKITGLTHENSIKPGNGILIDAISGRSRFARGEETTSMQPAIAQDQVLLNPMPSSQPEATPPKTVATPEAPTLPPTLAAPAPDSAPTEAQPTGDKDTVPEETPRDEAPETDPFTAIIIPKGSELRTWIGMKMWSISGSSTAMSQLPPWILNAAGASVFRQFSETIDWNYGLDLGYGPTGKGSFFAYDAHAAARWHLLQKDILPGADDIFFGAKTSIRSLRVGRETSGGFDMTNVFLLIGVHGWAKPEFIGKKIEWTGEIFYPLYTSGSFGVRGKYRAINSGSSTAFKLGAYVGDRPADDWQYGAALDYESSSWDLANSKSAQFSSLSVIALARRNI